jgi:hypothetical protein
MKQIKYSFLYVLLILQVNVFGQKNTGNNNLLPWQREISLSEAAQSVFLRSTLEAHSPYPDMTPFGGTDAAIINNLKMRTIIWGTPNRITISVTKNDVWDRRLNPRSTEVHTLQEITEGAFSPLNKDYVGRDKTTLRPKDLGYLRKDGGSYDPYRDSIRYAFPCLKPVGQIILGIDPLEGAQAPDISQSCANGIVSMQITKGDAQARIEYVLGMTDNVYAIRGDLTGIKAPIWLRLYRHRDTSHLTYKTGDGKYKTSQAEADKKINGPIDPPTSGKDGRYFWIYQRMPAEKTFSKGFEYVMMGLLKTPGNVNLESVEGKTGLGMPVANQPLNREWKGEPRPAISDAPGAAATATFSAVDGKMEALVTIVTSNDGTDIFEIAKNRLAQAEKAGFDGIVQENTKWWNAFYEMRENGRIFHGLTGTACTDDIREIYRSYADSHGGGTKTDMRHYECSASYAVPERDFQEWDGAPCYNEIFTTSQFVRNRGDNQDMWKEIVEHWMPAAELNAREMFDMPGMCIVHGYLPPVKPDKYVHTTITLEFCLGTMAQIVRPVWNQWDYGGDTAFLRKECYPLMKQMALFYAAYSKMGSDGYYHIIPSMEEERWGFYPKFVRNKDVTSSLCMFKWGLTRAADAAQMLGVDSDLQKQWREVASHLTPYATWQTTDGLEYANQPGIEPTRLPPDHFGEPCMYPVVLADEINLDSQPEQKEMMERSVHSLKGAGIGGATLMLIGIPLDSESPHRHIAGDAETLLNSRSGRIHIFPAVAETSEVAFHNFQARSGFLVSAAKDADGIYYVEIGARRSVPCQVMNPWPGKRVIIYEEGTKKVLPVTVDNSNGECIVFSALKGHNYLINPDFKTSK